MASWFDGWNLALASLDADRVAQRYWDDAVLLATVSNRPRADPAAIRDYFVHFLEKHPRGRVDTRTVQLGCNVAVDAGTYSFSLMDETGAVEELSARFTYVYTFRDGQWRISHHHSSAMPEPVPEVVAAAVAAAPVPPAAGAAASAAHASNPDPAPQHAAAGPAAEPRRAASPLFMNAAASPGVMEFYPIEARVARETGSVGLRVCAGPDGKLVGEPAVLRSSGSERLDVAARNWAKAARWVPATSNRRAVEACVELTARFEPR
ncbi:MAG: SgcJ/EcaC family oxidoreductase [Steroidobacteraceae bacterium]